MEYLLGQAQVGVAMILGIAAFLLELFALVDAVRHPSNAYPAAGKRTKTFWVAIVAVSAAVGFIFFANPLNLLGIAAVLGAAVYLADVRPALQQVRGRGSSSSGPYGPW
ncbi:DUF2516 family protein [Segeticoccus rhizosphaerae]|jgi:hypothetical protein|uniref:DUF2516 family protein n=1 Tax=Segeticoccus rhizosphaerae TaxID=1104777 RepID=UPI0010C0F232|nr:MULTISPECIES: DUF2516 family protein [Intrasporangiaceae]